MHINYTVFRCKRNLKIFIIVMFIIFVIETINQSNKLYLNQNRRIWKYSLFQPLPLSLNVCWIKWRKFPVSMYVKNLHSPILNFYWIFYSKELLNLYFSTAIKIDSVKTSLRDIFQAYLWCLRRFCKTIIGIKILRHQIEFVPDFIFL